MIITPRKFPINSSTPVLPGKHCWANQVLELSAGETISQWSANYINTDVDSLNYYDVIFDEFESNSNWYLFISKGSLKLVAKNEEKILTAYNDSTNWSPYQDIIYDKKLEIHALEDTQFLIYKTMHISKHIPLTDIRIRKVFSNESLSFEAKSTRFYVLGHTTYSVIGAEAYNKPVVPPEKIGNSYVIVGHTTSIGENITIETVGDILVAEF